MKTIDMTAGSPTKKMLLFSLPILLGNLFQQVYSLSDTLVVGRFLGKEALAAVGSSSAIVVLINSIIIGLCMGASVLFAEYFASKNNDKFAKAISTSSIFIAGLSLLVSFLMIIFINPLLWLFQIPSEAFRLARDYLYIVLSGLVFLSLYNLSAAILRAKGDSKTPLIFLIVSTTINVAFDFIFVLFTPLGVMGPALSTLVAQIASGLPLFIYMLHKMKYLHIKPIFDKPVFKKVLSYSVLTSLQQSIMNFGILLVQGLVNSFGVIAIAAFAIGVRIDAFAYMPAQDFANGFAFYVSQNRGAHQYERICQGFKRAIIASTIFCGVITLIMLFFAPTFIRLFAPEDLEVITLGSDYLRIEGVFYILIGYLFLFYALNRGLGKFKTSIVLTITSLGTRVLISYVLVALSFGIRSIWWSIPLGWALADILGLYLYRQVKKDNFKRVRDKASEDNQLTQLIEATEAI